MGMQMGTRAVGTGWGWGHSLWGWSQPCVDGGGDGDRNNEDGWGGGEVLVPFLSLVDNKLFFSMSR